MSRSEIQRTCGDASGAVCEYFDTLYSDGFSPKHILAIVHAVLDLRTSVEPRSHILELIVSGPGSAGRASRRHVLRDACLGPDSCERGDDAAGYSIYNGKEVFKSLAQRMDLIPELRVTFLVLVHIGREGKDTTIETDLVARYAKWFVSDNWPGKRLPDMYYDPSPRGSSRWQPR